MGAFHSTSESEEETDSKAEKELFVKQLKTTYKKWCSTIEPIPFIRDRKYSVQNIFVEVSIEALPSSKRPTTLPLRSHHDVFDKSVSKSNRVVLIGEPGCGKSTLTLQYAYEWCNGVDGSHLKDVDVLIILRLRQWSGVKSIYRAIKQFILPKDSPIMESQIRSILRRSLSVVVILEGLDEYPDEEGNTKSDVVKAITTNKFKHFEVLLTTRYLPKQYEPDVTRYRLTGFDEKAQNEYLRHFVVDRVETSFNRIKRRLKENPVLRDICQVPLFFAMFAHLSHEDEEYKSIVTVTSFFKHIIECLHSHMRNKMEDENVGKLYIHEEKHEKLDEIAFKGLSEVNQKISWRPEELRTELGNDFYMQYLRIGVLVEEEHNQKFEEKAGHASRPCENRVRFYKKLFCEWYAAHHLANIIAVNSSYKQLYDHLQHVNLEDLQYLYRFACGLNRETAGCIIDYVRRKDGKLASLCILERKGRVDDILGSLTDLCSKSIKFTKEDSQLQHRSSIQLLEVASHHNITISSIWLEECYHSVNQSSGTKIQLTSTLFIPVLARLQEMTIKEDGRILTDDEFTGILQYSSMCPQLETLAFWFCVLPRSIQPNSFPELRTRNVKVSWRGAYHMNLKSGRWLNEDNKVMTDEDYTKEKEKAKKRKHLQVYIRTTHDMPDTAMNETKKTASSSFIETIKSKKETLQRR